MDLYYWGAAWKVLVLLLVTGCQGLKEEEEDEKRPYKFAFAIEGYQHRSEEKDEGGIIMGEFGFVTGDGVYHVTVYATDENGDFKILKMKNYYIGLPGEGTTVAPTRAAPSATTTPPRPPTPSTTASPVKKIIQGLMGCSGCIVPTKNNGEGGPSPSSENGEGNLDTRFGGGDGKPGFGAGKPAYNAKPLGGGGNQPFGTPGASTGGSYNAPGAPSGGSYKAPGASPGGSFKAPGASPGGSYKEPGASYNAPGGSTGGRPSSEYQPGSGPPTIGQQNPRPGTASGGQLPSGGGSQPTGSSGFGGGGPQKNYGGGETPKPGQPYKPGSPQYSDGLPPGMNMEDLMALLYKFNYTLKYHGHHESGYRNGDKEGGYFFNGRDGLGRNVKYIANEFGFQPNITLVDLGLQHPDTPKETGEEPDELRGSEFKWFYKR